MEACAWHRTERDNNMALEDDDTRQFAEVGGGNTSFTANTPTPIPAAASFIFLFKSQRSGARPRSGLVMCESNTPPVFESFFKVFEFIWNEYF